MKSTVIIVIILALVSIGISLFFYDQYKISEEVRIAYQKNEELLSELKKDPLFSSSNFLNESDLKVELISCLPEYGYVNWKGSVTSLADESINAHLVLTGIDNNQRIVTFVDEIILDLKPGKTEYVDRLLDDVSGFETCDYKIEEISSLP